MTTLDQLGDRELAAFEVSGTRIAIASVGDAFYAFGDTCTHRGCSLAEGDLEATIVTCPCHGSQFDVTTGEVLRGPPMNLCGAIPRVSRAACSGSTFDRRRSGTLGRARPKEGTGARVGPVPRA